MKTWADLIREEMKDKRDESPTVHAVIDGGNLESFHEKFDSGYGVSKGRLFTLWTEKRVYFPVCYDGAEWVGSVPRNPCLETTEHFGGG